MGKFDFGDWCRSNAFAIINLVIILVGFSYAYGRLSSQVALNETRIVATEARVVTLETKNDQIQKLITISEQQTKNISELGTIVSKDHDILIRFAALSEQNSPKK